MITTTILIVLGILLVFVLWQMMRGPKRPAENVKSIRAAPAAIGAASGDLWNVRAGDVVSIQGAAEDFSDLDFTVDQRSAYESGNGRWLAVGGDFRGRRVRLELSRASASDVMGVLDARRLSLPDIGVTEEQLADMDSRQDPSASIQFDGKRWRYESSRELAWFENEQGEPKGLYRWLFTEQSGSRVLCVDKWEGEPFDVQLARKLNAQDITVYRTA